jgi:hypothetical protein
VIDRATLAAKLEHFAQEAAGIGSPLYAALVPLIARDDALLDLCAAHLRPGQPPANMLFGAVHDRLMCALNRQAKEIDGAKSRIPPHSGGDVISPDKLSLAERLARFYPTLTRDAIPVTSANTAEIFDAFRAFCLDQCEAIAPLLAQRLVQTNEVRRCGYLAQACVWTAAHAGVARLALIDIGASIGLNLFWDRYAYMLTSPYGGSVWHRGPQDAAVSLNIEWRGAPPPEAPWPEIALRVGIDLNPLDAQSDDDRRWLRALVWPEHTDRLALLEAALAELQCDPPRMLAGDAGVHLGEAIALVPPDAALVVMHTHVFNQMNDAQRSAVHKALHHAAQHRPIYRIGNDLLPADGHTYPLIWQCWHRASVETRHLANVHGHGRWVEWRAERC